VCGFVQKPVVDLQKGEEEGPDYIKILKKKKKASTRRR